MWQDLGRSDRQVIKLLDSLKEGVILINESGYVIGANSAEARMLSLSSPRERIGYHFRMPTCSYFKADGTPLKLEEMSAYLASRNKRRTSNSEIKIVKPDGCYIWCQILAVPFVDKSSTVIKVMQTMTDITQEKRLRDELEQNLGRITWAQEEERKRLSRELHDETAQSLALIILELDAICSKGVKPDEETLSKIIKLKGTAQNALNEVRRYSHELRPSLLDNLGLTAAIESLVDDIRDQQRNEIIFKEKGNVRRLPDQIELTLFRITQEALTNIRKHSKATKARVNLLFTPLKVKLSIVDNGIGFDTSKSHQLAAAGHLGLVGMMERANLVKGKLRVRSNPGRGTKISAEVPIPS
jgi:signal transduction histidine kinase